MKFIIFLLLLPLFAKTQQTVTLDGSASTDPDGSIVSYSWKLLNGPAAVIINTPNAAKTTVSIPLIAGDYKFQLTVTDNQGAIGTSTVTVHVLPNPDHAPVITPAIDQSITLPVNSATLKCIAVDSDHDKLNYLWRKLSGPAAGIIQVSTDSITTVTGLVQGTYLFEVTVTDAPGAIRRDTLQILVNAANVIPISNGGMDQTITLPASTVTIGLRDPQGLTVHWIKLSGTGTIEQPFASITQVTGLSKGISQFRKIVMNSSGKIASDDVTVTVKKACFFLWRWLGLC